MSNDLISRKALLTELDKLDITKMYFPDAFKELVKEQPTAYDIDKIVRRLEDEIEKKDDWQFSNAEIAYWNRGIRKAIKIVKGGSNE
jgi:uncharacterized protein YeeX (DUF496 family)